MNEKILVWLIAIALFPSCMFNASQPESKGQSAYLLQGRADLPVLEDLKQKIHHEINKIIKEEIGLPITYDFDFFLPKRKSQGLTLYYFFDLLDKGSPWLQSFFKSFKKNHAGLIFKNVSLSSDIKFFGEHDDELVILVNDPKNELARLNAEIKEAAHKANAEFKQKHQQDLYDINQSEKHKFLPHIGLGRLRSTSIKQHIKDQTQVEAIYARITRRIIAIVKDLLTKETQNIIKFKSFVIFNRTTGSLIE